MSKCSRGARGAHCSDAHFQVCLGPCEQSEMFGQVLHRGSAAGCSCPSESPRVLGLQRQQRAQRCLCDIQQCRTAQCSQHSAAPEGENASHLQQCRRSGMSPQRVRERNRARLQCVCDCDLSVCRVPIVLIRGGRQEHLQVPCLVDAAAGRSPSAGVHEAPVPLTDLCVLFTDTGSAPAAASSSDRAATRRRIGRTDLEREYQQVGVEAGLAFALPSAAALIKCPLKTSSFLSRACCPLLTSRIPRTPSTQASASVRRGASGLWRTDFAGEASAAQVAVFMLSVVASCFVQLPAGACDLGLPHSEICSGLTTPPVVMSSLHEAWSRGCATVSSCISASEFCLTQSCEADELCHPGSQDAESCHKIVQTCSYVHHLGRRRWLLVAGAAEQLVLCSRQIRGLAERAHLCDALPGELKCLTVTVIRFQVLTVTSVKWCCAAVAAATRTNVIRSHC